MKEKVLLNEKLVDDQFLEDIPKQRQKPKWIMEESIAAVGAWEPLFHRRRLGSDVWVDDEKVYEYEHSEEFVCKIKEGGGNLLITAFEKNSYIDEDEILLKKQLVKHCRKHGLRLATYIRADNIYTECFEELLKEKDILSCPADGRPASYGYQEWRRDTCFHKPDALDLYKNSIRRAVSELGVDALHLDGFVIGDMETRGACRCHVCQKDFTDFLMRRYGADRQLCRRRFGHPYIESIKPPGMIAKPAIPIGEITNPVWQEWIIFRCTWTARIARIISEYAYKLNPEVAILANNAVAVKENTALLMGSIPSILGEYVDVLINEDAYGPYITDEGKVIQRSRQHKIAQEKGCWQFNYMEANAKNLKVGLAHAAAFNHGRVTGFGFAPGLYNSFLKNFEIKKGFAKWLETNWEIFQNLHNVADIVVWREEKAMAFADPLAYVTSMRFEQLLIEEHIPYTIVSGDFPESARVLVLPNLTCLSEQNCMKVISFVENGGAVLVIGTTSLRDGWGRKWGDFRLRQILPKDVPSPTSDFTQHIAAVNVPVEQATLSIRPEKSGFSRREIGPGRIGYVSAIVEKSDLTPLFNPDHTINMNLDTSNWQIPEKASELLQLLSWLAKKPYTFTIASSPGIIANYYYQQHTNSYYIHLVNLTGKIASDITIKTVLKEKKHSINVLSPFDGDGRDFSSSHKQGVLLITLKSLKTYVVVKIAKKVSN